MKKRAFLLSSLYYPNVGGVENSLRELSRELIGRGYDVFLITSNRDLVNNKILPETDIIDGVSVIRCNYPLSGYGFFVFIKNPNSPIPHNKNRGSHTIAWPNVV